MSEATNQLFDDARKALQWLLNNIRQDAPQLSGKAMGNAERVVTAIDAALSQPAPPPQPAVPVDEQMTLSFAQLKQILDSLDRCHHRDSRAEFLRTWVRDWAENKVSRAILDLRPADHPDTLRCIKARNDLNAALHGEGAIIDDLEHAVANACAKLRRPAVDPMTPLHLASVYAVIDSMGWDLDDQEKDDMVDLVRATEKRHGITAKAEGGA